MAPLAMLSRGNRAGPVAQRIRTYQPPGTGGRVGECDGRRTAKIKARNSDYRGSSLKVLGIKCSKTELGWMVLEGTGRSDAIVVAVDQAKAPAGGDRAEVLAWARKELIEVVEKYRPEAAALRATEGRSGSFQRAEMDGIVQATLYDRGIPVGRLVSATIRSKFKARNNEALESAVAAMPALTITTTIAQKDLLTVAASILSA